MTLKEYLVDWRDIDCAAMQLSQCLGIMDDKTDFIGTAKHVFWSNHPVGEALYTLIFSLVDIGVLEQSPEESDDDKVRWNPNYRGSWEL